jgi:hypothetical protein
VIDTCLNIVPDLVALILSVTLSLSLSISTESSSILLETRKDAKTFYSDTSGFAGIGVQCYNRHHALLLRPDDTWQVFVCRFSCYVQANAEALRERLVGFHGKKQLTVGGIGNLYTANYSELSQAMVRAIGEEIHGPTIADWIMPDFTATNDKDRTVAAMSMMATKQQYFTYTSCLACGIPMHCL